MLMFRAMHGVMMNWNSDNMRFHMERIWNFNWEIYVIRNFDFFDDRNFNFLDDWELLNVMMTANKKLDVLFRIVLSKYLLYGVNSVRDAIFDDFGSFVIFSTIITASTSSSLFN
jgi:hypothetical protein